MAFLCVVHWKPKHTVKTHEIISLERILKVTGANYSFPTLFPLNICSPHPSFSEGGSVLSMAA